MTDTLIAAFDVLAEQMAAYATSWNIPHIDITFTHQDGAPSLHSKMLDTLQETWSGHQKMEYVDGQPTWEVFQDFYEACVAHPFFGPIIAADQTRHLSVHINSNNRFIVEFGALESSPGMPPWKDRKTLGDLLQAAKPVNVSHPETLVVTDETVSSLLGHVNLSRAQIEAAKPFLLRDPNGPIAYWTPCAETAKWTANLTFLSAPRYRSSFRLNPPEDLTEQQHHMILSTYAFIIHQESGKPAVCAIPASGNAQGLPKPSIV